MRRLLVSILLSVLPELGLGATAIGGMERLPGGEFTPLFRSGLQEQGATRVVVEPFFLDKLPVSDADFARFVVDNPAWKRDRVGRLYTDEGYLRHWPTADGPDVKVANRPVVNVSWHAAKAYCAWVGSRLPTDYEWQFAAYEGAVDFAERLASWYSKPATSDLPSVGTSAANRFLIFDMYGPVWEWVGDFSSLMVSNDGRAGSGTDSLRFCGGGVLSANETRNYIGFMRAAYLGALKANYTTSSLGLRCARSVEGATK